MKKFEITGRGYDPGEFTAEDRARLRHGLSLVEEHLVSVEALMPLSDLADLYRLRKVILGAMSLFGAAGAALAYVVKAGMLP